MPKDSTKNTAIERRQFLKSAAVAGAGLVILPSGVLRGRQRPEQQAEHRPDRRLGPGQGPLRRDRRARTSSPSATSTRSTWRWPPRSFPKAKHYVDWRKCLEQKDIDAVICCTTDHTHAFIANWAMNRGLHVYCEKPLANTVEEARVVRATYLKNKDKLATQFGTQRHAKENFNRVRELIRDGAIGELSDVYAWGNRQLRRPGYLPAAGRAAQDAPLRPVDRARRRSTPTTRATSRAARA